MTDTDLETGRDLDLEALNQAAEDRWLQAMQRGPQNGRWTELPVQRGDPAPDFELKNSMGREVHLHDYLKDGPALLIFLRQFGCRCSAQRVELLKEEYEAYENEGARVVLIGQGEPERARAFAEKHSIKSIPILSDPGLSAYRAYGLLEGTPQQVLYGQSEELERGEFEAAQKLARTRKSEGNPMVDNPWMLPGEFVINQMGIIQFAYRYQYCDNFPDYRMVAAAIRDAVKNTGINPRTIQTEV